jgi:hypothetical protein
VCEATKATTTEFMMVEVERCAGEFGKQHKRSCETEKRLTDCLALFDISRVIACVLKFSFDSTQTSLQTQQKRERNEMIRRNLLVFTCLLNVFYDS